MGGNTRQGFSHFKLFLLNEHLPQNEVLDEESRCWFLVLGLLLPSPWPWDVSLGLSLPVSEGSCLQSLLQLENVDSLTPKTSKDLKTNTPPHTKPVLCFMFERSACKFADFFKKINVSKEFFIHANVYVYKCKLLVTQLFSWTLYGYQ